MQCVCVALLFSFLIESLNAQNNVKANSDCSCFTILSQTISKIETNYLGYHIEFKNKRETEYKKIIERIKTKAQTSSAEDCIFLLQEYLKFFRDGHLFISENPILSEEEIKQLTANAEKISLSEQEIRKYLDKNAFRLDPIEGIWYDSEGTRVGIIRDVKPGRRDFVAIMLSEKIERWSSGQVKAEFSKLPDGSYNVILYNSRHFPLHLSSYQRGQTGGAGIRRRVLLHLPPLTWGKVYPFDSNQDSQIHSVNPRHPLIYFPNQFTAVISIPSHSPEYAEAFKELIEKNSPRILQSETLIIDLRGDEGGSSWVTNPLLPFLETIEKRPIKYKLETQNVVLSSQDNIKYFEQIERDGWLPQKLIERMRKDVGKIIQFSDSSNQTSSIDNKQTKPTQLPRNVAILMDKAVISAGEAFILEAMQNKKVRLFGENTGGVIDYQNVSMIRLNGCGSTEYYLGYPMIAISNLLPKGGINTKGIQPDVKIGKTVKNWVQFVIEYYKTAK